MEECVEDTGKCGMGGYCKTCPYTNNQEDNYMTVEQENQYLRQVLVDLWSFFGEDRKVDDYIHDLDQIRGRVFNNLIKQEEMKQIHIYTKLSDDAKLEEIKKAMKKYFLPLHHK